MRLAVLLFASFLCAAVPALADTIVLKGGKKIGDVVVSRNDGEWTVINPWNSRHPGMTWGIPEKSRVPADKVEEVIIADPPEVELLARSARAALSAEEHFELALFCLEHELAAAAETHLAWTLLLDPNHARAKERFGEERWTAFLRQNPLFDAEARAAERDYLAAVDAAEADARLAALRETGSRRNGAYLERARRSARIAKGRRDKVPLTVDSDKAPGATYAIQVPQKYDPLEPTALVIGLHGGGVGGVDETLVTGSGEEALNFYQDLGEAWGWIVACPTAVRAPWSNGANEPLLAALLEEMQSLYNIDPRRLYLVGHSMGGFGAWHFAPRMEDVWAACAPCSGGGGPAGLDLEKTAVYIYHGADDPICDVGRDRGAAQALRGDLKKKMPRSRFVYTELNGVGHGFPDEVRRDIFDWFAGIRKEGDRRLPASSFERKPGKAEIKAFGDPSRPTPGGAEGQDAGIEELISAVRQGGGGGLAAAQKIGAIKTKEAARALASVLGSKKATTDAQVLAAAALGDIGLPECVQHLAAAVKKDDLDFRVVDAAAEALGRIGGAEAAEPLSRAGRRMGDLFARSFFGDTITHTEYEVRLQSFGILVQAFRKVGAREIALPLFQKEIVERVYDPAEMYRVLGDEDERFQNASPRARLALVEALVDCLIAFGDPAGRPLLERIRKRWPGDALLMRAVERGLQALPG
ncbi:MAG: hypothetical protein HY812_12065 [Planctomycetes bacterium]|nr:hypothetical protein [Planctomycetota bacterium]